MQQKLVEILLFTFIGSYRTCKSFCVNVSRNLNVSYHPPWWWLALRLRQVPVQRCCLPAPPPHTAWTSSGCWGWVSPSHLCSPCSDRWTGGSRSLSAPCGTPDSLWSFHSGGVSEEPEGKLWWWSINNLLLWTWESSWVETVLCTFHVTLMLWEDIASRVTSWGGPSGSKTQTHFVSIKDWRNDCDPNIVCQSLIIILKWSNLVPLVFSNWAINEWGIPQIQRMRSKIRWQTKKSLQSHFLMKKKT